MFHQYFTTFIFPPLKDITKHLFIMSRITIPFSFTFKNPALHKYLSASSLSKSSKFLILQFLVKCCKLHSVFRIQSKSHIIVGCPGLFAEMGGWASNQIFKKGGLDRTSTFRGGLLGKRVGEVFQVGLQFSHKNKLKSEIFNDKKSLKVKIFFSVITKISNW